MTVTDDDRPATKKDLDQLRTEFRGEIDQFRTEVHGTGINSVMT